MSATNRGAVRRDQDFYETPAWCVNRLLDAVTFPDGDWLEPAVGNGAIIKAVTNYNPKSAIWWTATDVRDTSMELNLPLKKLRKESFLFWEWTDKDYKVVITNPPYSLAEEFIRHALKIPSNPSVVMLLRLNFLASESRYPLFKEYPPDVYVLPNRPCFTGDGKTDATEYAWFVWPPRYELRRNGRLLVLGTTPAKERRP